MAEQVDVDRAVEQAVGRLERAGTPLTLGAADQILLAVHGAQGVIDNGGLRYFFENDWPGQPPYSWFCEAYRRIGAEVAAECIEGAAAMFPFRDPHLSEDRRREQLPSLATSPKWRELDEHVCGDTTVWQKLAAFVARNEDGI